MTYYHAGVVLSFILTILAQVLDYRYGVEFKKGDTFELLLLTLLFSIGSWATALFALYYIVGYYLSQLDYAWRKK